jgi:hypothetical protein
MRLAAQAKFASPLDREAWFAGFGRTALIWMPNLYRCLNAFETSRINH